MKKLLLGVIPALACLCGFQWQVGQRTYVGAPSPASVTSNTTSCISPDYGTTSLICTITGVTAGDALYVASGQYAAGSNLSSASLSDSASGSIISIYSSSATSNHDAEWIVANAASGSHTFTLTWSGYYPGIWIAAVEIHGASTSSPVDSTATFATGSTYSPTCNTLTASYSGELMIGVVANSEGTAVTSQSSPQTMTLIDPSATTGYAQIGYAGAPSSGSNYAAYTGLGGIVSWYCTLTAIH